MQLKKAALGYLANHNVGVPKYDPSTQLETGILHVGVGNFFRAHLAHYMDELFSAEDATPEDRKWGILGSGVTDYSYSKKLKALEEQDMLYTLVARDGYGVSARAVASLTKLLPYAEDFAPIAENLLNPDIKIVSTCITEGGYFLNPATGAFDAQHPDIVHDAANPDRPKTVMGLLVQALKKRRSEGVDPFTVLCCDNIPHGGDACKGVLTGLAQLSDPLLAEWIEENVSCPNAMVDRITPATGAKEIEFLEQEFGYEDKAPVFCEPFTQWVLEDNFCNGRPALEKVGVQFVDDVTPWEFMKIRILNGGHASLCYPSALLGLEYVHEAMEHPVIGPFLDCLERTEIIPGVPPVPETDLVDYWKTIQNRFENPTIMDRIDRNCEDGADRQPKFIIPPLRDSLKAGDGRTVEGLALVSAMWCRYCQGTTEAGDKIAPNDKIWDKLTAKAAEAKKNPQVWIDMKDIYGDTGKDERFSSAFSAACKLVNDKGVEVAMQKYIDKHSSSAGTENTASAAAAA